MKKFCLTACFVVLVSLVGLGQETFNGPSNAAGTKQQTGPNQVQNENAVKGNETHSDVQQPEAEIPAKTEPTPAKVERRPQTERPQKKVNNAKVEQDKNEEKNNDEETADVADNGLLFVGEGNYTISRIPEIVVETKKAPVEEEIVTVQEEAEEEEAESSKMETYGKVGILVFLFLVFVLYVKTRSRGSGKSRGSKNRGVVRKLPNR